MPSLTTKIKIWRNSFSESIKKAEDKEGYKLKYVLAIIVLGLYTRLLWLNVPRDLWHDEAFQWLYSQKPILYILSGTDVHPPVFNLVAKALLFANKTPMFLRYMMIFTSLYFLYYAFLMMLRIFDKKTAYYGTAMLALAPTLVYYATEFRNYQWTLLVIVCQILAFNVMLKDHSLKNRAIYISYSLLAMYSHYMAGLIVFCQAIYLFFFKTSVSSDVWSMIKQYWLKVYLPMFVGMIPLLYYAYTSMEKMHSFWFHDIGFHSLISTFAYIVMPPTNKIIGLVGCVYIGLAVGLWVYRKLLKPEHIQFIFYLVLPPVIMLIISMTSVAFYHHRYFLFGGLSVFVLLAWVLARWDDAEPEVGLCMVGLFGLFCFIGYSTMAETNNTELMQSAGFIDNYISNSTDHYALVHTSTFSQSPFKVYLPNLKSYLMTNLSTEQLFTAGGSVVNADELCTNIDCVYAMEPDSKLLIISDKSYGEVIYENGGLYISKKVV